MTNRLLFLYWETAFPFFLLGEGFSFCSTGGREINIYTVPSFLSPFFQICSSCPLVWFMEDKHGGWSELELKLKGEGLKLDGTQVTKSPASVKDRLKDLINHAQQQGVEVPNPPSGPVSYTVLVRDLSALGLLTGFIPYLVLLFVSLFS